MTLFFPLSTFSPPSRSHFRPHYRPLGSQQTQRGCAKRMAHPQAIYTFLYYRDFLNKSDFELCK